MTAKPRELTIKLALRWAQEHLEGDSARLDAQVLLAHCLGRDRAYLYTWPERSLSAEQAACWCALIEQRQSGVPVAHIVGEKEFWSLPLKVQACTLIPRPETELLVETALASRICRDQSGCKILDLGTGSGAIALALASELPHCEIVAVDKHSEAVALAQGNCDRLGFKHVRILQSDWFEQLDERFDIIISNPPYIDAEDKHLAQGDLRFEPRSALVAEDGGLADIRSIIGRSPSFLNEGGLLLLEHAYNQGEAVARELTQAGFQAVFNKLDLAQQPRVSGGTWQ